ncbi:hypothetical protein EF912_09725 [Streptomyces sp. WAC07061]|uniref:hypothetical protein n=1 Tax=Streptomyces sp. WAC07061 TaxID=2487410 RepID=UPI000F7773BB|nr:hypothetical protein [Streptomyces sp. WAC07061]RSS60535.1 hypothetical protein EF912_09725 [Streptomyces sp. WAC07061]
MTLIENLLSGIEMRTLASPLEWNPLREVDALQEVGLLDCRMCPLTGRAGLLLDMRTSLHYPAGNAALLVVGGLESFQWRETSMERDLVPFIIVSSRPLWVRKNWRMEISLFPDGELSFAGARADFHLLDAEGIPDAPPDYMNGKIDEVISALPWWNSPCTLLRSSTTGGIKAL